MKEQLLKEFNALGIADMEEVKELHQGAVQIRRLLFSNVGTKRIT